MVLEIERKFLVDKREMHKLTFLTEELIAQGYLSSNPTVRVRIKGNRGFLTIKSSTKGITRKEFEYEIPTDDAEELLKLCGRNVLKKIRRTIEHDGHIWEIDFFMGRHSGLVLAEVELNSAEEFIKLPDWVTREVSGDSRYYNSNLVKIDWSKHPWRKG
ncbi:MAG: CYTH domain-containing protein [Selenomonadaceae bacterium]|nr:CYTH domain-containing protein [Selenomonadaceae bacterium]